MTGLRGPPVDALDFRVQQRTAQALAELFGIPLSDGAVAAVTARAANDLG